MNSKRRDESNPPPGESTFIGRPRPRVLVAIAGLLCLLWAPFLEVLPPGQTLVCALSGPGPLKKIRLPDGTTVALAPSSCIAFVAGDFAHRRLVRLGEGEALFDVAADARRPFVIKAGSAEIAVLGTTFDVHRNKLDTTVSVIEGAIGTSSPGTLWHRNKNRVSTMQQADIFDDTAVQTKLRTMTPAELERITAWTKGKVVFNGQSLQEGLEEFKRYWPIKKIVIEDPAIARIPASGTFNAADLDDALKLLSAQYCIHVEYAPGQPLVLSSDRGKRVGSKCP